MAPDLISRAGIGLRTAHLGRISAEKPSAGFLEIHAENYMGAGPQVGALERLRTDYELSVHGVGLSLGSAEGLDERHLARLAAVVERFEPALVSEHLAWTGVDGAYLNDLLPLPYTEEALEIVVRNVDRAQSVLRRQVLVENPSRYLRFVASTIPEAEFLSALVVRAGCGLLCDVNNVFVSAHNTGGDPLQWLGSIPASSVGEFHLAGHSINEADGATVLIDDHGSRVRAEVWSLFAEAVARIGARPTLIEWDTDVPDLEILIDEASQADRIVSGGHAQVPAHRRIEPSRVA